jgi:hypothetical protein
VIKRRDPPYAGTVVAPDRTLAQIQELLFEYGCEAVQTTRDQTGRVEIRFTIEVEVQGVRRKIAVRIEPPLLTVTKGKGRGKTTYSDPARSYRLLYWYLKSKLEAVSYGLVSAEREFFSQVLISLPSGDTTTVGEATEAAFAGSGSLFLPGLGKERPILAAPNEKVEP